MATKAPCELFCGLRRQFTHSAYPSATAAEIACRSWASITAAAAEFNSGRQSMFDQLTPVLIGINSGGDGLLDWAELQVNTRLPMDVTPVAAEAWLEQAAPDCVVNSLGGVAAWEGPRTSILHRALARGIRALGATPRFQVKTGTADLNLVAPAWNCPALAYGPGDATLDHTPNEHIDLNEYLRSITVLEHALRYCAQQIDDIHRRGAEDAETKI